MGLFDFLKGLGARVEPPTKPVRNRSKSLPLTPYQKAKKLAECLYCFPYQSPRDVPSSVKKDKTLMAIITAAYSTTRGLNGQTQQTTIYAAERIRLQAEFKSRIYRLLERCLSADPEHAPAFLLYPKVAEYNTRAPDRYELIALYERFLPMVDGVAVGSKGYSLIEEDIKDLGGSCFDQVERHLADYHYDLAVLYRKTDQNNLAMTEYQKACSLCPEIYGEDSDKVKLM